MTAANSMTFSVDYFEANYGFYMQPNQFVNFPNLAMKNISELRLLEAKLRELEQDLWPKNVKFIHGKFFGHYPKFDLDKLEQQQQQQMVERGTDSPIIILDSDQGSRQDFKR